jgi:hypothetical protein
MLGKFLYIGFTMRLIPVLINCYNRILLNYEFGYNITQYVS